MLVLVLVLGKINSNYSGRKVTQKTLCVTWVAYTKAFFKINFDNNLN